MEKHPSKIAPRILTPEQQLSVVAISLLKGAIYQETDGELWNYLLMIEARVRDYVAVLGLELILDESEGYAFLRSRNYENDDSNYPFPRLIVRRPLSFPVSLLIALLRKKLLESDAHGGDTRLILSHAELIELIHVFLPEGTNQARLIDQIDTYINKIVDLGFLRRLKNSPESIPLFEVRRILKAFVDGQWLADFDQRLAIYQTQIGIRPKATTDE